MGTATSFPLGVGLGLVALVIVFDFTRPSERYAGARGWSLKHFQRESPRQSRDRIAVTVTKVFCQLGVIGFGAVPWPLQLTPLTKLASAQCGYQAQRHTALGLKSIKPPELNRIEFLTPTRARMRCYRVGLVPARPSISASVTRGARKCPVQTMNRLSSFGSAEHQ